MYAVVKVSGYEGDFTHVRKMRVFDNRDEANSLAKEWYLKLKKKIEKRERNGIDPFSEDFCGYIISDLGIKYTIEVVEC